MDGRGSVRRWPFGCRSPSIPQPRVGYANRSSTISVLLSDPGSDYGSGDSLPHSGTDPLPPGDSALIAAGKVSVPPISRAFSSDVVLGRLHAASGDSRHAGAN